MKRFLKPVIGVTPAFDEGEKLPASKASLYLRREYTREIAAAGAIPIVLSPDMHIDEILELCDGLIISGGEDIPAEVYGGAALLTVPEPLERVMWERMLIDRFADEHKPIMGICYGMQLLALHYGGALYQDIAREVENAMQHVLVHHAVDIQTDFLGLQRGQQVVVASRHHQAVAMLPDQFELCARAPDGVIEAMRHETIYGIQWHPESDGTGAHIYGRFSKQCRQSSGFTNRGEAATIVRNIK